MDIWCCIAVKFPNGKVKVYERLLSQPFSNLHYALLVLKTAVPYMQQRIQDEGGHSRVLGGYIR